MGKQAHILNGGVQELQHSDTFLLQEAAQLLRLWALAYVLQAWTCQHRPLALCHASSKYNIPRLHKRAALCAVECRPRQRP